MNQNDELWAYDEPHESGGNCHVTMTRRQAIDWFYKVYPLGASDDESLFTQWCALHWAYREPMASPSAPKEQARQ